MYDYVTTKPPLNDDTLKHFLGGAHKYLKKYMGKNGKWVYVYNKAKKGLNDAAYKTKNTLRGWSVKRQRNRFGLSAEDVVVDRGSTVKNGKLYNYMIGYKGDSGKAKSTGSSSGNKGYTRSMASLLQSRRRAQLSRTIENHKKNVASQVAKQGFYRPTSRKKKVGEGTGSIKKRGKGINYEQMLKRQRINGKRVERDRKNASESVRKNNGAMKKDPRYSKKK